MYDKSLSINQWLDHSDCKCSQFPFLSLTASCSLFSTVVNRADHVNIKGTNGTRGTKARVAPTWYFVEASCALCLSSVLLFLRDMVFPCSRYPSSLGHWPPISAQNRKLDGVVVWAMRGLEIIYGPLDQGIVYCRANFAGWILCCGWRTITHWNVPLLPQSEISHAEAAFPTLHSRQRNLVVCQAKTLHTFDAAAVCRSRLYLVCSWLTIKTAVVKLTATPGCNRWQKASIRT